MLEEGIEGSDSSWSDKYSDDIICYEGEGYNENFGYEQDWNQFSAIRAGQIYKEWYFISRMHMLWSMRWLILHNHVEIHYTIWTTFLNNDIGIINYFYSIMN